MLKRLTGKINRHKPHRVALGTEARPRKRGTGGRVALFAFSFADYARVLDVEVETVRKLAKAGKFDPTNLGSFLALYDARKLPQKRPHRKPRPTCGCAPCTRARTSPSHKVQPYCTCGHPFHEHGDTGCGHKVGSASCDDAYCDCSSYRAGCF